MFLKVEKIEKRKKKEVGAKHLLFLCGVVTAKQRWFGFKGLPIGVDCDDELMIEVVKLA